MITRNQNRFTEKKSNSKWSFLFVDKADLKRSIVAFFLAFADLAD